MIAPIRLKTIFRIACWNLPIIQNRLSAELKNSETKPHHQNPNKTKRNRQLSVNWQFSNTSGPAGGSRGSGDKVSVDTTVLQNIPPCTSNPSGVGHVFENLSPKFLRSREILKEFQQPANFFFSSLGFQSIASMAAHISRQLSMAAYRFPPSSPSQQHQLRIQETELPPAPLKDY